jgi:hypothetical protein
MQMPYGKFRSTAVPDAPQIKTESATFRIAALLGAAETRGVSFGAGWSFRKFRGRQAL